MTFAEEVEADSPELWWDTRQVVGTAQPDRAGNGHTGTLINGPTLDAVNGLLFDGSSAQRVLADAAVVPIGNVATFAVEAVVNMTSTAFRHVAGFTDNFSSDYLALTADPEPDFAYNAGNQALGPNPVPTGVLTHVMGTYDGVNLKVFVDGVVEDTTAIAADDAVFTVAQKFGIGDDDYGGDDFHGNIKHAIWYTHAPSPARVAAHAAAIGDDGDAPPPEPGTLPTLTLDSDVGDLTPYGEEPAFSIMRGTSSPGLTGFVAEAGTLGTQLTNISRDLDPLNLAGPFVTAGETDLLPGVGTTAAASYGGTDYPLFAGSVDGWPQTYPKDGTDQVVDFRATDIFRQLANAQLTLQRPSEYSGARIQAILDDFGYAGPTDIAHGNAIVGPLAFTTVSALSHIADVVMAEWGEFYESAAHVLTFRDRDTIATDTRSSESQATYVQSGGLNFSDVQMKSSTVTDIVNECVVVYSDTGQQVTERDEASIAEPWSQGIPRSLQISVPLSNASQARAYARWILQRYAWPINTFTSVTLTPGNEPAGFDLWPECLGRELGDLVTVVLDPLSAPYELSGDPITRECVIRGIQRNFESFPWSTTFYLQDASWQADLWRWDVSLWDGDDVWGM